MGLSLARARHRCDRIQECISLDLDGELSRLERARVDRHLAGCADCKAFRAEVHAFTGALRSAPLEQLERPVALPTRRRVVSLRSFQVAAAAAVAIAAVGLTSLSSALREEQLGARAPSRAIQVDRGTDQLRARQLQVLTEQVAETLPRPAGIQPV